LKIAATLIIQRKFKRWTCAYLRGNFPTGQMSGGRLLGVCVWGWLFKGWMSYPRNYINIYPRWRQSWR